LVKFIEEDITKVYPDYSIEKAYDGEEALKKIKANPPDLIITGIVMPNISGLQMLVMLHDENKDIPTIILSGGLTLDVLKTVYEMQLSRQTEIIAISKPFNSKELIQAIEKITRRSNEEDRN
jgi:YesN/AraC family two-component response regulator